MITKAKIDQLNSCFGRKFDQIYTINQLSDRTKISNSEISVFLKERVRLGRLLKSVINDIAQLI